MKRNRKGKGKRALVAVAMLRVGRQRSWIRGRQKSVMGWLKR